MKHSVIQQLSHFTSQYAASEHVYLAYSGGLDSTVLLHALCETLPDRDRLTALHINHNLQSDSSLWEQKCESQCRSWGVNLKVHCLDLSPGSHEEERARDARYAFFSETINVGEILLMAHHLNDAVETFLFRLMRGSSSSGLSGIPQRRTLGKGYLHRPLLHLKRVQLEEYAKINSLEWVQDPSNYNIQFDRNYLRSQVLPALLQRWPGALDRLSDSITRLAEDNQIIVAWLDEHLDRIQGSVWELDSKLLANYSETQGLRLLRHWLERCGCFLTSTAQLKEMYRQCSSDRAVNPVFTLSGVRRFENGFEYQLRKYRTRLLFCKMYTGEMENSYAWSIQPGISSQVYDMPHGQLKLEQGSQSMGPLSLEIRFSRPGQKVQVPDASRPSGRNKTLTDIFQEAGVPPWQRKNYPLVYDSETLLAIPGIRTLDTAAKRGAVPIFSWVPKLP